MNAHVLVIDNYDSFTYNLVEAFGGCIEHAPQVMHGKSSMVYHAGDGLFADLPAPFSAGRYHSLCTAKEKLPKCFELSAWTSTDEVMAVRHRDLNLHGVQFHPESVLTPDGPKLIENFLRMEKGRKNGQ